jgi:hypothetical protein
MKIVCGECRGSGIAEYIAHWARPCDACHGDGDLNVPMLWGIYFRVADWLDAKRRSA